MEPIQFEFAERFARKWVTDWNSHNLENILSHYSEDFIIESPLAEKRIPESKGKVIGKANVRAYWRMGLDVNKNLEFEIIDILCGVSYITIYYKNISTNKRVAEMLHFNEEGLVDRAVVNYSE
jgi:SnoaL-like domain